MMIENYRGFDKLHENESTINTYPGALEKHPRQVSTESEFNASDYYARSTLAPPGYYQEPKREGVSEMFKVIFLPVLNVAGTCALVGIIIYIYQKANGQTTDMTIAGMRVPTILALIMTIVKMLVAGGITFAVSEYKWIQLQSEGSKLALLDIYDGCTRGVGGIIRVLTSIHLDKVLIPTVLFQFGLIAMGPASQQILSTADIIQCVKGEAGIWYTNFSSSDISTLSSTTGPGSVKGLKQDSLVRYAFEQAALGFQVQPYYECKMGSLNCTYTDLSGIHTTVACQNGTLDSQIIDLNTNNVSTLNHYYGYDKPNPITSPSPSVPGIFYSGSMVGRTYFDLNNYTAPLLSPKNGSDASIRKLFGDQSFVMVLTDEGTLNSYLPMDKKPQILECTLQSTVNSSMLIIDQSNVKRLQQYSSTPLIIDYDTLSNATYWKENYLDANFTMLNAYAMQLSILKTLIADGQDGFQEIVENWLIYGHLSGKTPDNFFVDTLHNVDLTAMYGLPANPIFGEQGTRCFIQGNTYQLSPAAYYCLALSLLLPLIWWTIIWIISLHQSNGVSRGNSQVALMVTGLTAAARQDFKGLSHSGQREIFAKAKEVNVVFGETRSSGHIAFGTPEEMKPVRTKRYSTA
ncbi:hypothetical protein BJV82DRAFT_674489 [Fennellomyces sp. T-0311]|nr:hypothetical protein BJV82DRAFT_674489 [Fennellomyces sp. T-0311]